jgi:hypothetical protein
LNAGQTATFYSIILGPSCQVFPQSFGTKTKHEFVFFLTAKRIYPELLFIVIEATMAELRTKLQYTWLCRAIYLLRIISIN